MGQIGKRWNVIVSDDISEFHDDLRINQAIKKMRGFLEPFTDDERFMILSILEELDLKDKTLIQQLDEVAEEFFGEKGDELTCDSNKT